MSKVFIRELDLVSFGQFENKKLVFDFGFNLIYGKNESGKSTVADFLEGLLYGFDDGKKTRHFNKKRDKYRPLTGYKYFGYGIFDLDGEKIRLERDFESGAYKMLNLTRGEKIQGRESDLNFPGKFLLSCDYEIYKAVNFNYQFKKIGEDSKKILFERLSKLGKSGSIIYSYQQALEFLDKLDKDLGSDRAYTKPLAKSRDELVEVKKNLRDLEAIRKRYQKDFLKLDESRRDLKKTTYYLKNLREKEEEIRGHMASLNYVEAETQRENLKKVQEKLRAFPYFSGIDQDFFDNLDSLFKQQANLSEDSDKRDLIGFALILILGLTLFLVYKKFVYLLILLGLLPFIRKRREAEKSAKKAYDLDLKIKRELAKISVGSKGEYLGKKEEFLTYQKLLLEKEKIAEILRVLNRQEMEKNPQFLSDPPVKAPLDLKEQIKKLEEEVEDLYEENISLEKSLASKEDALKEQVGLKEKEKYLEKKLADIEKKKEAIRLASIAIKKLSAKDSKHGKNEMEEDLDEFLRRVTKNRYKGIKFSKDYRPLLERSDGSIVERDKLSTGLSDQLNFALTLSFFRKLTQGQILVFDDALINYDDERLTACLYFLLDAAEVSQVLYFTCLNREENIFKLENIRVNKIYMEDL